MANETLKLKSLVLEGFRSFKDRQTVNFNDNCVTLITGNDPSTGGSSGAGKSSIPMAVSYVLGFCDLPKTELKNWDSKGFYVELTLQQGDTVYKISRDPKLSIEINGEKIEGLNTALESKLSEIVKTTPTLAKTLTYRPQRESGVFVSSTDAEKKEFLVQCLHGLSEIEIAEEKLSAISNTTKNRIAQLQHEVSFTQSNLASILISDEDAANAKKTLDDLTAQFNVSQNGMAAVEQIKVEMNGIVSKLNECENIQRKVIQFNSENNQLRSNIEKLYSEVQVLKEAACPTCRRQWGTPDATQMLNEKQKVMESYITKMQTNMSYIKNAEVSLSAVTPLKEEYQRKSQEAMTLSLPANSLQTALMSASQNYKNLSDQLRNKHHYQRELERKTVEIQSLESEDRLNGHLLNILGRNGFLGSIFDEILLEIESRTNKMLAMIPNVSRFTVSISSTSETKKGTIKKTISTKILKDGKDISIKSLSGGQRCSVELCADLAVAKTIQRRSGSPLGWIMLDEAMDGLDSISKTPAIEMIKQEIQGLVLIIDHDPEVKATFDNIVEVEYDGRHSRITNK